MERDLGVLWEWKYDEKFIELLDSRCEKSGKTSYLISSHNLEESMEKMRKGELEFEVVLDRASGSDSAFLPIIRFCQERRVRIINDPEKTVRANNRAVMHFELIKGGIQVPHTLILTPKERINDMSLGRIGHPFVVKKAEAVGGGEGVFLSVQTVDEVNHLREMYPEELLLIQEAVVPRLYQERRCWFRVFFVCGKVIPCFWDDLTHVYQRMSSDDEAKFLELVRITEKIHEISGLEFFSTEVAITGDRRFVVVDYVNDQCDMRFQSDTPDGVPDLVIQEIVETIVASL